MSLTKELRCDGFLSQISFKEIVFKACGGRKGVEMVTMWMRMIRIRRKTSRKSLVAALQ